MMYIYIYISCTVFFSVLYMVNFESFILYASLY